MITRPTSAQLIDEVRRELSSTIAPLVTDPQAQGSLQMVDHILATLAVRAEHEIAWMTEEIDDISRVVDRVASSPDAPPSVREALDSLRSSCGESLLLSDVTAKYALASEALSRAIDATVATHGPLHDEVSALLDRRLEHETDVIGEFQLVGRG
jgi:hypothetical protein